MELVWVCMKVIRLGISTTHGCLHLCGIGTDGDRKRTQYSENLGAFVSHFTVKNTFATLVRDKMKHNKWFYSFEAELIFGDVIYDLIK